MTAIPGSATAPARHSRAYEAFRNIVAAFAGYEASVAESVVTLDEVVSRPPAKLPPEPSVAAMASGLGE
jgi:hypothetical protein